MSILLVILAIIVGLVAVLLIAALFVKRDYIICREVVISRPVDEVFDYLRYLRNQENFSKFVMIDPNKKTDFRGRDGSVGSVYAWEGNQQAGKGEQEIKAIHPGQLIDIEVRFERPFKSIARTPIATERITETQTKVTWGMEVRSKYPVNLMTAMMAGVLGKDLEVSLATLKRILETRKQVPL